MDLTASNCLFQQAKKPRIQLRVYIYYNKADKCILPVPHVGNQAFEKDISQRSISSYFHVVTNDEGGFIVAASDYHADKIAPPQWDSLVMRYPMET